MSAKNIRIRGIVQGVGFRPQVYRLARTYSLTGWVLNREDGVEIHVEGSDDKIQEFAAALRDQSPPGASIRSIEALETEPTGCRDFIIHPSAGNDRPTAGISPDLGVCVECLSELFDPDDRRFRYPYINCSQCGPRFTVIEALPYDRRHTTMRVWPMDDFCSSQYSDPADRRFHAQPLACSECGPHYYLRTATQDSVLRRDWEAIQESARLLRSGRILAVKGLGGYHLACDARNDEAVSELRERKFRKEKPFALMGRNLEVLRTWVHLSAGEEELLLSPARPIVLARARSELPGVAPDNRELGVMLPYSPLHHLLLGAAAPALLVMTSANRSSEPIAYRDDDALQRFSGLADAFLMGERPIARRVDDSVVRYGPFGPSLLRRARGYSPRAVVDLPVEKPILALGADLKNTITLVVDGQAFVSQHIGDLGQAAAFEAFRETVDDLLTMYDVDRKELLVVGDAHPQYASTTYGRTLRGRQHRSVQHHRAHLASVLAERRAWSERVAGASFDGTGYGDDGTIWGGEIFVGSLEEGLKRVAHLRPALLAGGDAAARHPVQAAAGFLRQLQDPPDFSAQPFSFPERFDRAIRLLSGKVRVFPTTSAGRLFDAAAALLGFTRPVTFEGQAASWLEHQAARDADPYPFPFGEGELDFRPLLEAVIEDRLAGKPVAWIARAFHRAVASGLMQALSQICARHGLGTVVLSGGVFQNRLLLKELRSLLADEGIQVWTNQQVPPNDGGISLGQAALAVFGRFDEPRKLAGREP